MAGIPLVHPEDGSEWSLWHVRDPCLVCLDKTRYSFFFTQKCKWEATYAVVYSSSLNLQLSWSIGSTSVDELW